MRDVRAEVLHHTLQLSQLPFYGARIKWCAVEEESESEIYISKACAGQTSNLNAHTLKWIVSVSDWIAIWSLFSSIEMYRINVYILLVLARIVRGPR